MKKTLIKLCIIFVLVHRVVGEFVIIVGAGAAGIATATKLLENNFTDFLVLEAENRTGGRIFTVPFGESFVDLGAEWCGGEKGNIVFDLVKDFNILRNFSNKYANVYHSGQNIDKVFGEELQELFFDVYGNVKKAEDNTSIGDYFIKQYNETVTQRYSNNVTLVKWASEFKYYGLNAISANEGCLSLYDCLLANHFEEVEGDQYLNWNGKGFKTILDVLMKKYPNPNNSLPIDDKILLNEEVMEIIWDDPNSDHAASKTLVKCSSGRTFSADLVVVTVSAGVLKEKSRLFTPKLPPYKTKAIQDVGFGGVLKLFVWYPQRWWSDSDENLCLVWSLEDRKTLIEEGRAWIVDCFDVSTVPKNPNVLAIWFAGARVPEIEVKSDEEILSAISFVFEKFFSREFNLTTPEKIIRFNWMSEPHFRGTYSYESMKSRNQSVLIQEELARPLVSPKTGKHRLLFAGEATNLHHYANVHGAIETGYREAKRILELNKANT